MKKIIALLLALTMTGMLAACAGSSQGTTEATTAGETTAAEETAQEQTTEEETHAEAFEGSLWVGAGSGEIVFDQGVFPVEGFSGEVHTNPYVRTLLIQDVQNAAIVSLELVNTPEDIVDSIKDYVAEKTGTPRENVWVHSNHTITTPHAPEDETQRNLFVENVMAAATESIDEAAESLKPAAMGIAVGECDANINKDIELKDGWYIGSNPDRYSDKTMTVIRFDDAQGTPIAIYYNYGMKPTTIDNTGMKDGIRKISSDCTGLACTMLEEEFGCPAMFVMPATGDQQAAETTTYYEWDDAANEAKKIELSVEEGIALSDKYGKMIGDAAIELAKSAVCDQKEIPVNVSATDFSYDNANGDGQVKIDVSAITLGDEIAFVGVKPELNAITGHQLAEQSPYKYTLLAGFLNGDQKYMPDEEAYDIQSWEFKRTGFGRGAAEEFVNVAVSLLTQMQKSAATPGLKAGAGSSEIVFDGGIFPVEGFSGEIHTNPFVRTLLLEDTQKAAIVSLELVNTPEDVVTQIKDYVADRTGTPKDNVWVHSNHNITTPHAPEDETKRALFVDNVMTAAIESIDTAAENFQPAVMGIAQGECDANINKDIELKDGWYIGSNPDRYSDKTMTIIRFNDLDGNPLAIYMNYGMKPTTIDNTGMKEEIRKISADCTGTACVTLEDEFGCPVMFVMPATGDQQAAETTTYYEWDDAANEAKKIELSVEEGIALSDKYAKMMSDVASELASSVECSITDAPILSSATTYDFANANGDGNVTINVSAMTLGDEVAFVGIKSELNAITGHQLAEQSPYKYTLVTGFLNGDQKYMPDEEAYDIQSWEFKRSGFGRGCAEEFVNVAIGLLDDHKEGIEHKVSASGNAGNANKNYETLDIGGLKWLVLDDRDGKQLVISDAVLGNMAFKAAGGDTTWEDSDARTFLNGTFYDTVFSDDEKARIEETVVTTPANSKYGIAGGNDTTDRIFLLSVEEMQQYLEGSDHMIAIDASNAPAWYSLRTMGEAKDVQACVTVTGEIDLHGPNGGVTNEEGGLRPAMWIRKY